MRFPCVVMLFLLAACGDTTAPVPSHEWSFEETGDPLIGAQIRVARINAETGPTSLYIRCQATAPEFRAPPLHTGFNGLARLQIYVTGETLTQSGAVRYRFDQQPEREETWIESTDFESLFYPFDTRSFAQMIADADTLRLEYSERAGNIISSTFAVRGLEGYIDRLFANCLASVLKVSGDGQTGMVGSELANPLVVEVRGDDGNPTAGAQVSWIMGGAQSGSVSSTNTITDAEGHASVRWTIGSNNINTVQAVSPVGIVTFTASSQD